MIKNRFNSIIGKVRTSKKQREEELMQKVIKLVGKHLDIQEVELQENVQAVENKTVEKNKAVEKEVTVEILMKP